MVVDDPNNCIAVVVVVETSDGPVGRAELFNENVKDESTSVVVVVEPERKRDDDRVVDPEL